MNWSMSSKLSSKDMISGWRSQRPLRALQTVVALTNSAHTAVVVDVTDTVVVSLTVLTKRLLPKKGDADPKAYTTTTK